MPTYTYRARDAGGKRVNGTMESASKAEVIDKLHKMGYMTTGVSRVTASGEAGAPDPLNPASIWKKIW